MNNLRSLLSLTSSLSSHHLTGSLSVQFNQLRFKPCHPKIRGPPRPTPFGQKTPESSKYNYVPIFPPDGKYTIKPLKIQKLGGRDPETGRVVVKTVGGGNKKYFRWIDYERYKNEDGTPFEEKVYQIRYDPLRSTKLALVGGGEKLRWIMATEKMMVGDMMRTYSDIPRNPVRPREGDSHPVGALPIGTKVHNVQILPGHEKTTIRYAGQYAEITRRVGRRNYLSESKNNAEMCIDASCMVTVGRLSNPHHDSINLMCAQRSRWLGIRPKSGAWHRKDGYCGRKIHPPKPARDHFTTAMVLAKGGKTLAKPQNEIYTLEAF